MTFGQSAVAGLVTRVLALVVLAATAIATPSVASAAVIFADNFSAGASPLWGNESGGWSETGGDYNAAAPSPFPNAHSLVALPGLTDFTINVDVNGAGDGGIWLRSSNTADALGVSGILFVLARGDAYWHDVSGGSYGSALSIAGAFSPGANLNVRIEVVGNLYSAFLNGSASPITTLTNSSFGSGLAGLYDNASSQSFDNFSIETADVPAPAALPLLLSGLLGLGVVGWRRGKATDSYRAP